MSNYALIPVDSSEDFKNVNELLCRDDIIVNSINYKTDIVKFPLIIEIEYVKRLNSLKYAEQNNIKSFNDDKNINDEAVIEVKNNNNPALDSVNDVKESAVLDLDTSHLHSMTSGQSQDDNVKDKVIISASELKPYSETLKQNKKTKTDKQYYYCHFILDGVENIKYLTAKNLKSVKDNIHTIHSRYKKSKGYEKVAFKILKLEEISRTEYDEAVNNKCKI